MKRTTTRTCLVAAAALLLSGCGPADPPQTVPVSDGSGTASAAPPALAATAGTTVGTDIRDCPDAALRWGQAEHSPAESAVDWPIPGRFVETSSGTILEKSPHLPHPQTTRRWPEPG